MTQKSAPLKWGQGQPQGERGARRTSSLPQQREPWVHKNTPLVPGVSEVVSSEQNYLGVRKINF